MLRHAKRPSLDPAVVATLTQVSPWRSIATCLVVHAAVVALAWAGGPATGWLLAIPAILVIGALQEHLLVLFHDGAHGLLHPDRRTNDLANDILCGVPLFLLTKNYRLFHLTHHRYAGSPTRDPEVTVFGSMQYRYERRRGWPFVKLVLADLSGVNQVRFLVASARWLGEQRRAGRVRPEIPRDPLLFLLVWGGVGTLAVVFGFWIELLVFWLVPALVVTPLITKLHGYGEHTGATGPTEFERTWVHRFNPVADFFLYPLRSGLHLEHHLYPRVPWYNLRKLRAILLSDPDYAARAERVTVDAVFFGPRSLLRTMLLGEGEFRREILGQTEEIGGDPLEPETGGEVDAQLGGPAAVPMPAERAA